MLKIDFQPMPKRFMVWDKKKREFVKSVNTNDYFVSSYLYSDTTGLMEFEDNPEFLIVQSTNLFDKNGKEIFEGSIVEYKPYNEEKIGIIKFDIEMGSLTLTNLRDPDQVDVDAFEEWENGLCRVSCKQTKVIGHILSNPELLEEK